MNKFPTKNSTCEQKTKIWKPFKKNYIPLHVEIKFCPCTEVNLHILYNTRAY